MFLFKLSSRLTSVQNPIARCLSTNVAARERKRFYKDVTYSETTVPTLNETVYEINLDKRKLKTPLGKLFYTKNEQLANLIVHEWKTQEKLIDQSNMHFTTLQNTCIDNPMNLTKEQIIGYICDYIKTDTILYRDDSSEGLLKLQNEKWTPYVEWVNAQYKDLNLTIKYDLVDNSEDNVNLSSLKAYFNSLDLNTLISFKYMCENLKSVILSLALLNKYNGVANINEICDLSLLEAQYQISKWGEVEWFHSFELNDMLTRVCASYLFMYFNMNFHNVKSK